MNLNNIIFFPKKLFYQMIFPFLLVALDHSFWILINTVSGSLLIKLIRKRRKHLFKLKFNPQKVLFLRQIILRFVQKRSRNKYKFSSCLSRSITAAICLEIIGIATNIQLGINKSETGEIVPHAWLTNSDNTENITSPLYSGITTKLFSF